jgi:hypothetical protein
MTASFVQGNTVDGGAGSVTQQVITLPSHGAGNLIVLGIGGVDTPGTLAINSVVDSAGNSWTVINKKARNTTQQYADFLAYTWNTVGSSGTLTVTVTYSAATTFTRLHLEESRSTNGAWWFNPFVQCEVGTGNTAALLVSPPLNASSFGAIVFGFGSSAGGNVSQGAGFTMLQPAAANLSTGLEGQIQTAPQTTTVPMVAPIGQWAEIAAVFADTTPVASGLTPIYSWPYPLSDDPIVTTQMENAAIAMDNSFHSWDLNNTAGRTMNGVQVASAGQVLPLNTDTIISFTTENWDDNNYWVVGSPTIISLPVGVYFAVGFMHATGTASGMGLRLKLNGTTWYDQTVSVGLSSSAVTTVQTSGMFFVTAPSQLTMTGRWFGSGTGGAGDFLSLTVTKLRTSLP